MLKYVKKVSLLLIAVTLLAGMAACDHSGDDGNGSESVTLTIDSTAGGAVTVNNATIHGKSVLTYDAGTVVILNAIPDIGYQFVRWTGDVYTVDDVYASETIITMNGDYSITAGFEVPPPVQYILNIIGPAHGSVTSPGEGMFFTYEEGTVVNLVAKPDDDYEFARWTGDVDTIADINAASTTITMNGDYYISAHFREIPVVCYADSY
jgi:hypothetical protein